MSLQSKLKSESAATVGVLEAVGIYLIYSQAVPNVTDVRSAPAHNTDVDSARRSAAIKSAALLGVVFLVTRDVNAFIIGGAALFGIDCMYKHANGVNPSTGKLDSGKGAQSIAPDSASTYNLPDYTSQAA